MTSYFTQQNLEPMTREELERSLERYQRHDDYALIFDILRHRRGAGSEGERAIIESYIMPHNPHVDEYGNLIVTRGDSSVLWSCHTDTVCRANRGDRFQRVRPMLNATG